MVSASSLTTGEGEGGAVLAVSATGELGRGQNREARQHPWPAARSRESCDCWFRVIPVGPMCVFSISVWTWSAWLVG